MPEVLGRLRTPRLAAPPASPVVGEVYYDTALGALYWWNGTAWQPAAPEVHIGPSAPSPRNLLDIWIDTANTSQMYEPPQRVTSLAGLNIIDGAEVYYVVDAAKGIIWHLRLNVASGLPYQWEFVGGPPLYAEVLTSETNAVSTYAGLTTAGPSITVPAAGDYDVEVGAETGANIAATQHLHVLQHRRDCCRRCRRCTPPHRHG